MEATPSGRGSSALYVDLAALFGLAGIVVGALILAPTDLGFDRGAALAALFTWIPVTLPVGIAILVASLVDVAAGIVLARAVRRRPFERLDEALLQGFVFAVIKDAVLLGILAGPGLFTQPILLGVHALILAAGALRARPILAVAARPKPGSATPFVVLLIAAWAAPILLQLASPVVPFVDVLPNHVAPAEHLRTFGTLTNLTDTQSPIYGASRILLGYTALLGTITTGSGLPAGEGLAGFILPSTLLVAVAVHRLAGALGGDGVARWALLTFAMTTSMARLGDARATVIVLPLAAWALATLADYLADPARAGRGAGAGATDPGAEPETRRRLPPSVILGLGLGAAMLVHPVIGFLAAMTIVIVVLVRPAATGELAIPALGTGAVIALPQAATMVGIALPPVSLIVALAVGPIVGGGLAASPRLRQMLISFGRLFAGATALLALILAAPLVRAAVAGADPLLSTMELMLAASLLAVVFRAPAARSPILWAALATGFGVAMLGQLVPEEGSGLLGDALRFELPKTLHYWVPVFMAILAASGIHALLQREVIPAAVRGIVIVAFVGTVALPIRAEPIDAFHLGEHRLSETFSIALRWVEKGFWRGYPDARYVVDAPRREILSAVRAEIAAGRMHADTPILHVAGSFQQWIATPLGVFAGVTESDVTPDAVVSIHTVGGRLHPLDELPALLTGAAYPFVLFEPSADALPPGIRESIVAAGYAPVFSNAQGELFALGPR